MCSCDIADDPKFYSEDFVVARKEHQCCECPFPISAGEQYLRASGVRVLNERNNEILHRCDCPIGYRLPGELIFKDETRQIHMVKR